MQRGNQWRRLMVNRLKQALFEHIYGEGDVEDITTKYFPAARSSPADCDNSCQTACEVAQQQEEFPAVPTRNLQAKPTKSTVPRKVIKEEDMVFCVDCRYYTGNNTCTATRRKVRDPITGTWSEGGDVFCFNVGDCSKYKEIPDCDLKFASYEKYLHKFKLLRVFWDGRKGKWQKRIGIKRVDDL
jgi:hypothetical protein